MITFRHKGDLSKTTAFMNRVKGLLNLSDLDRYGQEGVAALASATPVDSGKTASCWEYEIVRSKESVSIIFKNTNVNKGVPIAIILQYGHGTRNGGYVQGRDYINPAIQPVFDKLANDAWEEVKRL